MNIASPTCVTIPDDEMWVNPVLFEELKNDIKDEITITEDTFIGGGGLTVRKVTLLPIPNDTIWVSLSLGLTLRASYT